MKIKIFYSWQSTTDSKYNRYFISKCIEKATKEVSNLPEYKSLDFEIKEAIRGEPGTPSVADTILNKIIPDCDIFIADLSVVNSNSKALTDQYHPFINNNVVFEYGNALSYLGYSRIIGVLNSEYGDPKNDPSFLPFDIRHKRFPVKYKYSEKNYESRKEIQAALVADLKTAIIDVLNYILHDQKSRFNPFITYSQWSESKKEWSKENFIVSDKYNEIKNIVLEDIDSSNFQAYRLLGLSGLGKTRILFEIFRSNEDIPLLLLSERVLYVNLNDYKNSVDIPNLLGKIKVGKPDAIIIVDNCDLSDHNTFVSYSKNSTLSIITVNNNPEEFEINKADDTNYIVIKKDDFSVVVEELLEKNFDFLDEDNTSLIRKFSQGIPLMAVLLSESVRNGEKFLGRLDNHDLLDKLLGEKAKDPDWRAILRAVALFDYIGFKDELDYQYKFIAKNKNITISDSSKQVRLAKFNEVVNHYSKREIFEFRGRFISLRPFPLAMNLAQEWLVTCDSDRLAEVINDISKLKEPHRNLLANSLAEQMKFLGFNENAKQIVEKLVGVNGPFVKAEVLNTELGSRLFRSFVEVNPKAVSDNLYRIFSNKSTAELMQIDEGRRNLIWALEKLCFDRSTFTKSVKILYSFAVAENESWSNNATGQFTHLFNIILPGTEASLEERFSIIEWGLEKEDDQFTQIALKAMRAGLNYGHFHRTSGPEIQGTRRLEDFQPSTKDIYIYWSKILTTLVEIIKSSPNFSEQACTIITDSMNTVFLAGFSNLLIPFIEEVASIKEYDWDGGLTNLRWILNNKKDYLLNSEDKKKVEKLIEDLTKNDFISRFYDSNRYEYPDSISFDDQHKLDMERMESLALEFVGNKDLWDEYLAILYKKSEKYVIGKFHFGRMINQYLRDNNDDQILFIDKSINTLEIISPDEQNLEIISGFIVDTDDNLKNVFYSLILESKNLKCLFFHFVSQNADGKKYINKLFELVETGDCDVTLFATLKYGVAIREMNIDELQNFKGKLIQYKEGWHLVFSLFYNIYDDNINLNEVKEILKGAVLNIGVYAENSGLIVGYEYENFIIKTLNDGNETSFAESIMNLIFESFSYDYKNRFENRANKIMGVLIKKYFITVWPIISDIILTENKGYNRFDWFKRIFSSSMGNSISPEIKYIFEEYHDIIFEWCHNNKPLAPERLAEIVPIFGEIDGDKVTMHPASRRLIDNYGYDPDLLYNISFRLGNFSWTGSLVGLFESQKALFLPLVNHKFLEVRQWADQNISYLDERIKHETISDAERFI